MSSPDSQEDALTPPSLDQVCRQAAKLSCSPILIAKLFQALGDPDTATREIIDLIRTDTGLAVETLRLANSPLYGGISVETLNDALFRLGTREIIKLASHQVASTWLSLKVPIEDWDSRGFLRKSVSLAVAAEFLANKLDIPHPELAYTAGLLQDTGRLAMAICRPNFIPVISATCRLEGNNWVDAEERIYGFSYVGAGTALLKVWEFPEALIIPAQYVLDPALAPVSYQPLLTVLHAARVVADAMEPEVINCNNLFPLNVAWLKKHRYTRRLLEDTVVDTISRVREILEVELSPGTLTY